LEKNGDENITRTAYTAAVRKELLDFYDAVMQDFIADSQTRSEIQIDILLCCGFLLAIDLLTEVTHTLFFFAC
jgi:hypothetical protein